MLFFDHLRYKQIKKISNQIIKVIYQNFMQKNYFDEDDTNLTFLFTL